MEAPKSRCSRGVHAQSDRAGPRCFQVLSTRQHGDSRAARYLARRARRGVPRPDGPSGAGKTTLLKLIAGIDRPDAGSVAVAGTDVTKLSESEAAPWPATHIRVLFQFYNPL